MTPEDKEQIKLMDWLSHHLPDVYEHTYHIPLQRKCTPMQGQKLKRMGVKAGFSDLFIAVPTKLYSGLFIELKAGKGKLDPKQVEFIKRMNEQGYLATAVWGFDAAKAVIESYII